MIKHVLTTQHYQIETDSMVKREIVFDCVEELKKYLSFALSNDSFSYQYTISSRNDP